MGAKLFRMVSTLFTRVTTWPRGVFLNSPKGFGAEVAKFILFLINAMAIVIAINFAARVDASVMERVLSLSIELLLMGLYTIEEILNYVKVVESSEEDGYEERMRLRPPWYPATLVIMFVGSVGLVLTLLYNRDAQVVTLAAYIATALLLCFAPIGMAKLWQLAAYLRRDDALFEGYVDYIAIMLRYLRFTPTMRAAKLAEMEVLSETSPDKRSEGSFEQVWERIISPKIDRLLEHNRGVIECDKEIAYERVRFAYCCMNLHCSENYMMRPGNRLDRHKVAACYMLSIVAASPLDVNANVRQDKPELFFNERLAFTVGYSVLCSFIAKWLARMAAGEESAMTPELKEKVQKERDRIVNVGLNIPREVGHGENYPDSFLNFLRYTKVECNYSPLAVALLLFSAEADSMDSEVHSALLAVCRERNKKKR